MRKLILVIWLALIVWGIYALNKPSKKAKPQLSPAKELSYEVYDDLLRATVQNGRVNYTELLKYRHRLENFLIEASLAMPSEYIKNLPPSDGCREANITYWVNVYNALSLLNTLKIIPREKIEFNEFKVNEYTDFFKVWCFPLHRPQLSLDDIESNILIKYYGAVDIHFALCCSSRSCPELRSRAYTPDTIHEDMAKQGRDFVMKSTKLDLENNTIHISRIFKWNKSHFIKPGQDFLSYFKSRWKLPDAWNKLNPDAVKVEYLPYDWRLNSK